MNNISVTSFLGLFGSIGIILLLRFLIDLLFRKKQSSAPPVPTQVETPAPAATPVPRKPPHVAWVRIAFLLLCIAIYAALEYGSGASIAAAVASLPSSSPLHFLAGNSVNVISYAQLFFWALIVIMSLAVFNNVMLVLFAVPQNRNVRKWVRHLTTDGRPLFDEDFGAQTKAVETFVKGGDKDALLKFFNAHDAAPEWLAAYQERTISMWILVASATLLLSLIFFLWSAHDKYLAMMDNIMGNVTIPNLSTYQTEMVFAATFLLLAGFSAGTLCWSGIVQPIERLFGRRSRRRLIMEQSKTKSI